jgi:hypothetical protein
MPMLGSRVLRTVLAALAVVACSLPAGPRPAPDTSGPVALTGASVVDVERGTLLRRQTVVIHGDRIRGVGRDGSLPIPPAARIIDARDRYVMPGLWDMHAHHVGRGSPDHYAALFLANGVTGAREMGDDLDTLRTLRQEIADGRAVGPRLVFGGRVDGSARRPPYALLARDSAEAREAVRSLLGRGVDFIKVPLLLSVEAYRAVAEASRTAGIPFAGHVPHEVTVREASAAGQASLEHEDDLMLACTKHELALKGQIAAAAAGDDLAASASIMRRAARAIREQRDDAGCASLIAELARNGTWVTPTLVVYRPYELAFGPALTEDTRLRYIPASLRAAWRQRARNHAPEDTEAVRAYFDLPMTAAMQRAGVRLMTGTDAPLPYVLPGFALHEEVQLLVKAGLSNAEALKAATLHPARFLGVEPSLGTVAAGKVADLVVLRADPLRDIRNTTAIEAVFANGKFFDRSALDRLLAAAEQAAGVSSGDP